MPHQPAPVTLCNHPEFSALPPDNRPLTPPIYQSVKFTIQDFRELPRIFSGEREGYFYSRISNPTCVVLERLLAQLQGTESARSTATGIAAITGTLLGLLQAGDRLLYFVETYSPSRVFADGMLKKFGIQAVRLNLDDHEGLEREMAVPGTKALLFESITNPVLRAAPLDRIHRLAQKHGVITILDNTFAGFQSWPDWPFDLYIHSLTKYANGHGDVMGGAILGSEKLLKEIDEGLHMLGASLDPHAAFLIQRGLKTYHLRRREQCTNAMAVATWLSEHAAVEKVVYPGLRNHPQHAWFQQHFADFGTMIFLYLKDKNRSLDDLVTKGQVFQLAGSLGSTESLIAPALYFFGGDLSPEECARAGIDASSLRLSIGIEDVSDLCEDLERILS